MHWSSQVHGASGGKGEDWDHEAEAADDDMDMGGEVGSDGEPAPPSPEADMAPEGLRPEDSPSPSPAGRLLHILKPCLCSLLHAHSGSGPPFSDTAAACFLFLVQSADWQRSAVSAPHQMCHTLQDTIRFSSTISILAKHVVKYYRTSGCTSHRPTSQWRQM